MKRLVLLTFLSLCMTAFAFAQTRTISGTVTDNSGEPLIGATVLVVGTSSGTVTDLDGNYEIRVPEGGEELEFSYTGFISQTVAIGASNVIDVVLEQDVVGLEEVVVIGYTPQRKKDVTGSVSSVNTEDVEDIPLPTFEAALQGTAAGVVVNKASGAPGSGVDVNIRGRTSVLASNQPLYVVDGVPVISSDNFDFTQEGIGGGQISVIADLNPDDIESIEVLKDASTAAIYGSRAANGVVLITTKKGKAGKTKFTLNSSFGNSWLPRKLDLISGDEYQEYSVELWGPLLDAFGLERNWENVRGSLLGLPESYNANTDWQEEVFYNEPFFSFDNAPVWEHSATMSGGNQRTKFFASVGYSDQTGIIRSSGFTRLNGRLNLEHQASDKLSFGVNMGYTRSNTDQVQNDNNIYGVLGASILIPPIVPIMEEDGSWGSAFGIENAVAAVTDYDNNVIRGRMQGNIFGNWDITDNLSFRVTFGTDILNVREEIFEPSRLQSSNSGRAVIATVQNERFINEYILTYTRSFGLNNVQVVGGVSFQEDQIKTTYTESIDFPTDDFTGLTSGATPVTTNGGFTGDNIRSQFINLNYNYAGKYYITGTFRRDGSSRFIDNQYGYFPGVSAGWNISSEEFLADGPFDLLKLRAGWGQTGNNVIGNFLSRELYGGGRNYQDAPGIGPSQIGNADLRWETTTQTNVGLDVAILNNRLSASIDYYIKNTDDLLLNRPIPTTSGFTSVTENVGEVRNTGIDLSITSQNVSTRNLNWTTTLTLGYLQNEVLRLVDGTPIDGGFSGPTSRIAEGQPLGSFFGHLTDGIFQNEQEVEDHATQPNAAPGDIRFQDISGGAGEDGILGTADDLPPDGVINDADRTFLGKALPDFQGGLRNTLTFAGFDVNIFFQFATGFQVLNYTRAFSEGMNSVFAPTKNAWDNRWQEEGDDTDVPRLIRNDPNSNRRPSDRFIEDGDYLRLKTLTIGYTLPSSVIDQIGFSRVRVYFSGYNLYTWTGYSGYDPEVSSFDGSNVGFGTDFLTFPQPRSFTFGINIGL